MSDKFSVYCILKVTEPPVSLIKRQNGAFYCHIPVPIPEQLVVFCEGNWSQKEGYQVTLTYKDDEIQLGQVTQTSSCLMWKKDSNTSLPESMTSEKEKGLAKLVCEISEGVPLSENGTEPVRETIKGKVEAGEDKDSTGTPERSGKNKRRTSLNKSEKQSGPCAKKQKIENTKHGDTKPDGNKPEKTPKTEKQKENKSTKSNSPAIDKVKPNSRGGQSNSPATEKVKAGVKGGQTSKNNSPSLEGSGKKKEANEPSSQKNAKKEDKQEAPDKELKEKKGKKDNKNNEADNKKGRRNSRKDSDIKSPMVCTKDSKNSSDGKIKRRKAAKQKLDNVENEENLTSNSAITENDIEKCNKENIHFDSNVVRENVGSVLKESLIEKMKNSLKNGNSKQKIATCRDLTTRVDKPDPRWGHSFCFVSKNMSVLIGGQGEKQQLSKDGVWALDNETRRWRNLTVQTESQKPEYRMGHSATYDPLVRCIYVFGGSKNTRWFHDVHMLDLDEWKWQLVKVNGKAPTRAYHSATLYRHELWIFGGVYPRPDPQPDGCSNDIHIFSPVMESWYTPIVKGEKPIPRSGHSATLIEDQLVVFGGWDAPISYSDLHVLDMSIVEWTQPEITGTPPSPRSRHAYCDPSNKCWHASCALSNKRLLIHGGYNGDFALEDTHIFNLDLLNWTQILVEHQPSARAGHKAVCMPYRHDNEEEDEIIIFGGGDNDGAYFNDLHSVYIPFEAAAML